MEKVVDLCSSSDSEGMSQSAITETEEHFGRESVGLYIWPAPGPRSTTSPTSQRVRTARAKKANAEMCFSFSISQEIARDRAHPPGAG